jgi:hypothetical protein
MRRERQRAVEQIGGLAQSLLAAAIVIAVDEFEDERGREPGERVGIVRLDLKRVVE